MREQQQTLGRKLRGHFGYYGITGNLEALQRFRYEVLRLWWKWLQRRTREARWAWSRFVAMLERYPLRAARVVHSVYSGAANP